MDTNTSLATWSAPSKPHFQRSRRWYIIVGGLALAAGIISILRGAWSVTVVTILLAGVYFLVHRMEPPTRTMEVFPHGFRFGRRFIPWTDCEGFWILQSPHYHELHIARKGNWNGDIVIQTGTLDPRALIALFKQFLPHQPENREKLIDVIIRICQI